MTDYTELRAALDAGPTPGPYRPGQGERDQIVAEVSHYDVYPITDNDLSPPEIDARYIAAADPSTIRALLAERDALRAELDRLTTLRPMSDYDEELGPVLWFDKERSFICAGYYVISDEYVNPERRETWWAPIPKVKP